MMDGMDRHLAYLLASRGVVTMEDLAATTECQAVTTEGQAVT